MILYHGSNQEILTIDLSKSRPHKDFGQGFYLTGHKDQAQKMAEQKVIQYGGIPTVNTYELDEANLTVQYYFGTDNAIKLLKRL